MKSTNRPYTPFQKKPLFDTTDALPSMENYSLDELPENLEHIGEEFNKLIAMGRDRPEYYRNVTTIIHRVLALLHSDAEQGNAQALDELDRIMLVGCGRIKQIADSNSSVAKNVYEKRNTFPMQVYRKHTGDAGKQEISDYIDKIGLGDRTTVSANRKGRRPDFHNKDSKAKFIQNVLAWVDTQARLMESKNAPSFIRSAQLLPHPIRLDASNAAEVFDVCWRAILASPDCRNGDMWEGWIAEWGEYREEHSVANDGQKVATPKTAESNVSDGIKESLWAAFKSANDLPRGLSRKVRGR